MITNGTGDLVEKSEIRRFLYTDEETGKNYRVFAVFTEYIEIESWDIEVTLVLEDVSDVPPRTVYDLADSWGEEREKFVEHIRAEIEEKYLERI